MSRKKLDQKYRRKTKGLYLHENTIKYIEREYPRQLSKFTEKALMYWIYVNDIDPAICDKVEEMIVESKALKELVGIA